MNSTNEKSIRCDCIGGEHYINFTLFTEVDGSQSLSIDLWAKSKPWGKRKWQMIWDIIKGRDTCYDGIILEKEKQEEIIEFLKAIKHE